MFGSAIIDVAIGLVFVYLLFSLVCSALNELGDAALKIRASYLEEGIRGLVSGNTDLAKQLYANHFIATLGKNPSYIPARNFALALLDHIAPPDKDRFSGAASALLPAPTDGQAAPSVSGPPPAGAVLQGNASPLADLRNAVAGLGPVDQKLSRTLLSLIDAAGHDVTQARKNIEDWFNSSMDRVSGRYKRRMHWTILGIGLAASILYNIDTISIAQYLSNNAAVRNSLVTAAQAYAAENAKPPVGTATPTVPAVSSATAVDPAEAKKQFRDNLEAIRNLGIPMGWCKEKAEKPGAGSRPGSGVSEAIASFIQTCAVNADNQPLNDPRRFPDTLGEWGFKSLGWLCTAIAVSFGAPFWFDTLNKIIVVRSTVKPTEKSPNEPSKA